ncbi:MAG: S-layer homology domain-containing protein [Clostridia bacterium]|nr:S-layer homology domain-containing protein [Clostridia bacterium]
MKKFLSALIVAVMLIGMLPAITIPAFSEAAALTNEEMSEDFRAPLTDGKIVFNYAKPSADDEAVWLIAEEFCMANPDFYFDPEGFNEDFTKVEIGLYMGTEKEEVHEVDVVWNYDPEVLQSAQAFIEKFPEGRPWFNVSDLELVNYWVYRNPDSELDSLANYSGELKAILGNSNFLYNVEVRGGADDVFYTERIGSAKLIHDGKVYFASSMIGARAEHAIYVPESTADTKDALIAAAQKKIDDYIGENVIKITAATETVTDYYNNTLAEYDEEMANAQEIFDRETAKPEEERDWLAYWDAKFTLDDTPGYKQYFIDSFNEGGDLHFLKNATGDFFFNVEIIETEETYKFVIIKDDDKLVVPTYATVDLNTNISVTADSSTIPLDTMIEVEKLTEGEEYDRIIQILDVEENETFDIKLHSGSLDKYVTKLGDGKFEVKIPVPEKLQGKALTVYYVDQNNEPVEYDVTPQGDFVVFATDHFSIYTLAETKTKNPFKDVKDGEYYTEPVLWAVSKKITNGMTADSFAPNNDCTRAQSVTFLWRAVGSPEPTSTANPFKDVNPDAYYYKAVLWAAENGITNGIDATHFAPDAACTRGQAVTFLHRANGKSTDFGTNAFTDVKSGTYYYDAVRWAVKNEITNGMSATSFAPDATCTRGQIVTFLYRAYN